MGSLLPSDRIMWRHRLLLGTVAIGDDRLQTSTILGRDQGTDGLSHMPSATARSVSSG
jgi:hypothetical protein